MNKRVLMVSVDAPPNIGGVANFSHHCANQIADMCEAACFVGPRGTRMPEGDAGSYQVVADEDANTACRAGRGYPAETARIEAFLEPLVRRHEINHLLAFHAFYYGPALTDIARKLGISCDFVVHGTELTSQFPDLIADDGDIARTRSDSLAFQLYYALNRADRIFCNSGFTRQIARRIAPHIASHVCGCGISRDDLNSLAETYSLSFESRRELRRRYGGRPGHLHLCYVGRLVRHKRVERILDVLKRVPATLSIVGDGPERDAIAARAAELEVAAAVTFHGTVVDGEKWRIVAASDFLMLPSQYDPESGGYEGFGIVLLEAAAVGTIPISSACEGASDPVHDYGIGFEGLSREVGTDDTASLLSRVVADENEYVRKVEADRHTIEKHLLWEHVARRMTKEW